MRSASLPARTNRDLTQADASVRRTTNGVPQNARAIDATALPSNAGQVTLIGRNIKVPAPPGSYARPSGTCRSGESRTL